MYVSAKLSTGKDCGCGCKGAGTCGSMGDAGDGLSGFMPETTTGKLALVAAIYFLGPPLWLAYKKGLLRRLVR